ncbi:hypothetical protein Tco_1101389 [Tanacetum coccineum]
MNSPPNYGLQSCKKNPSTQNRVSSQNPAENPVRIIPDLAEYVRKIIENVSDVDDFTRGSWFGVVQYLNVEWAILLKVEGFEIGGFELKDFELEGFEVEGFDVEAFEDKSGFEVEPTFVLK